MVYNPFESDESSSSANDRLEGFNRTAFDWWRLKSDYIIYLAEINSG